jgi:hypothetical protein
MGGVMRRLRGVVPRLRGLMPLLRGRGDSAGETIVRLVSGLVFG